MQDGEKSQAEKNKNDGNEKGIAQCILGDG